MRAMHVAWRLVWHEMHVSGNPEPRASARSSKFAGTIPDVDNRDAENRGAGAMSRLCEGRVAVVTGAGRGIGREHARLLAAHGAKVVVNDLGVATDGSGADPSPAAQVADEIRASGGEAVANGDDISDWNGAKRLIDQAVETFGRLDVVINNAGILRDRMLANMSEEEWDAVIRVHLKGTFLPSRHAAAYWRDRSKSGGPADARLINTSSSSGLFGNVGQSNYGAAKAGIAAFTIIAARELKRYGVTANAIMPHAQTRMTEDLRSLTPEQRARRDARWVPPIVVWLASKESADVTGRVFEVGGGFFAVMEGWHRGPAADPVEDPTAVGAIVSHLVSRARRNAGMDGQDLD
jgi:NAD(P)-dependent dehydrogenase (short-subunit alcohol dehydrogenase family)